MTVCFLLKVIGGFCLSRLVFLVFVTATPLLDFFFQHTKNGVKNSLCERVLFGYQFLVNCPNHLNCIRWHYKTLLIYTLSKHSLYSRSSAFKIFIRHGQLLVQLKGD